MVSCLQEEEEVGEQSRLGRRMSRKQSRLANETHLEWGACTGGRGMWSEWGGDFHLGLKPIRSWLLLSQGEVCSDLNFRNDCDSGAEGGLRMAGSEKGSTVLFSSINKC